MHTVPSGSGRSVAEPGLNVIGTFTLVGLFHASRCLSVWSISLTVKTRSALYAAYWRDGRDIADHDVLLDVATTVGLDPQVVAPLLADRVALAQRRRQMATHRRDGVGGVPVILASRTLVPGLMSETQLREMAAQT